MSFVSNRIKGIIFLLFTVFCWVGSAALIKVIFKNVNYTKPFFMTYIADGLTSLYALTLLRQLCKKRADEVSDPPNRNYIKLGIIFAPCLFIPNYLYAEGLLFTSISSAEIIANSSFIYIFLLSMPILGMKFSWIKLFSIAGAFGGICLVQLVDHGTKGNNPDENLLLGDIISIISAMMYAGYAVFLKKVIPEDDDFNWFGFFGVVGIVILVIFFPMFFILNYSHIEVFELPSPRTFLYLVINGIFGTVISNYTWGRSVVLLNPLIAELGIGLTLPLGLVVDYFLTDKRYNVYYLLGSVYIMSGFIVVTLFDYCNDKLEEMRKRTMKDEFMSESVRTSLVIEPKIILAA